jgi:hypothetical protein
VSLPQRCGLLLLLLLLLLCCTPGLPLPLGLQAAAAVVLGWLLAQLARLSQPWCGRSGPTQTLLC